MSDPEHPNANSTGHGARLVAIIADGNGRWAKERGLPIADGHTAAADALKERITDAIEFGIRELVVYVFSTENWSRPAGEVADLMEMFARRLALEAPHLDSQGVRVRFLGRREELSEQLIAELQRVQDLTAANETLELYLAFNYGGRAEIMQAARRFDGDTEEEFRALLYAPQMQDPEVIIRTGGDQRLSNYLLWQSAYSELVFRSELWPDFTRESFEDSLRDFSDRRRRFGGREEQLVHAQSDLAVAGHPPSRFAAFARNCSHARLLANAWLALAFANVRYWRTVSPLVESQIAHWRTRAEAIVDAETRSLALAKLDGERFNAEAGAMLATFAPASHRLQVVEAIVALQLLFDLLDGLSERPAAQPIADGERLFAVFTDALSAEDPPASVDPSLPAAEYIHQLASAARRALSDLPARDAVIGSARAAAARAAGAQIHMHAAAQLGVGQLQRWAQTPSSETSLPWRELTAGAASSVLCLHALIAAAAEAGTSPAQAKEIDRAYLCICVLLTLLDSLTDREQDARDGRLGYVDLYEDSELLSEALDASLARADKQVRRLADSARHLMILVAVVAYYASAPGANGQGAAEHVARLRHRLQPLIAPTMLVMRLWRARRRRQGRV